MITIYSEKITDNFCELKYLHKIISVLENEINDNYALVIVNDQCITLPQVPSGLIKIVIMLSDEIGIVPPWIDDANIIFRSPARNEMCDYSKIFPIPLGFNGPLIGNSYVGEQPKKKLIDREYDFFYSGKNTEKGRKKFFKRATKTTKNISGFLNGTIGWQMGDNYICLDDYYEYLNNSKIAFAPKAVIVPETFRYFEGYESNSIVITDYPIHQRDQKMWYYEDSPAIFLKNWWHLNNKLLKSLLTKEKLEEYQEKNSKYYNSKLSSKAVAQYILDRIDEMKI